MTTYRYHVTLNDSELIAIESALNYYITPQVQSLLIDSDNRDFVNHFHKVKEILDTHKLEGNAEMTSTSSFVIRNIDKN
jgi:hypothetical protein